jgi:hypothetical protein
MSLIILINEALFPTSHTANQDNNPKIQFPRPFNADLNEVKRGEVTLILGQLTTLRVN